MPSPENLSIELELTYLACKLPKKITDITPVRIVDIYVPEDADFPAIRLRQRGNTYEITKKVPVKGKDFSAHTEQSIPLTAIEFAALSQVSNRIVKKDRYTLEIDSNEAEIDVFCDKLAGLVLIDFEFTNEEQKHTFHPYEYCLADVTQESFILGGQLAGKSYSDIEADLARFGYSAIKL